MSSKHETQPETKIQQHQQTPPSFTNIQNQAGFKTDSNYELQKSKPSSELVTSAPVSHENPVSFQVATKSNQKPTVDETTEAPINTVRMESQQFVHEESTNEPTLITSMLIAASITERSSTSTQSTTDISKATTTTTGKRRRSNSSSDQGISKFLKSNDNNNNNNNSNNVNNKNSQNCSQMEEEDEKGEG